MTLELDLHALSMTEIIRLQTQLTQELAQRFETSAAICFTDIVGSTAYFARFGDVMGRQLQQMHIDIVERVLAQHGGRLVDTAGDGAVAIFGAARDAATAMCVLQHELGRINTHLERDHQLVLRIGMHYGRVLTDGVQVTGDVVNLCSRIAASAAPGEIRLSHDCFRELAASQRMNCHPLGDVELKGAGRQIPLVSLDWLDRSLFPVAARVRETGETFPIPLRDIVSFGRMAIIEGMSANDVVLSLPDGMATRQISRWHFELRRRQDGYLLRSVTTHRTVVDGKELQQGDEVPLGPGSVVLLSGVMTLDFIGAKRQEGTRGDETIIVA